ncbi:MAG: hypothetical protein U5L74_09340, partial [Ideonella sp.]|nr:hypothetical protein [Ideonella sp.]
PAAVEPQRNVMRKIGVALLVVGFIWLGALQILVVVRAGIRPVLAGQYHQLDAEPARQYSASEVEAKIHATASDAYDAATRWFLLPGLLMLAGGLMAARPTPKAEQAVAPQ